MLSEMPKKKSSTKSNYPTEKKGHSKIHPFFHQFHPVSLLGIGIILGIVLTGFLLFLRQQSITRPQSLQTYYYPTPSISAGKHIALPLPLDTDWQSYSANCSPLQGKISISYPAGWQLKEFQNDSNTLNPMNDECSVIIGYPEVPSGSQDSPAGQAAEIHVQGVTRNDVFTLKSYLSSTIGTQAVFLPVIINGVQYARFDAGGSNYWFITQKGNLFITIELISFQTPTSSLSDPVYIDNTREQINNTFLQKLKIL